MSTSLPVMPGFCSLQQALAGMPQQPLKGSLGRLTGAVQVLNRTSGAVLECPDVALAVGYIAASRVLMPRQIYALMADGVELQVAVEPHPALQARLAQGEDWRRQEEEDAAWRDEWAARQAFWNIRQESIAAR